jgi:ribosomal silencing factor RsfS
MIFDRWRTGKTIRDLRKIKKEMSRHLASLTTEEWMRESKEAREWLVEKLGDAVVMVDKPFK